VTVEMLATRYVKVIRNVQPHGPYRLGGWSGGGIVAYETARQLLDEGQQVEFLGLIDSGHPDSVAPQNSLTEEQKIWNFLKLYAHYLDPNLDESSVSILDHLGDLNAALEHCQKVGWLPSTFTIEELSWRTALFWKLGFACLAYYPLPLPIPVHLFTAEVLPGKDHSMGWKTVAGPLLRIVPIGGNHFSIVEEPLVQKLGAAISSILSQLEDTNTLSRQQTSAPR